MDVYYRSAPLKFPVSVASEIRAPNPGRPEASSATGPVTINSVALAAGTYFAQAASIITYAYAARVLGPADFGALLAMVGLAILVGTFADFGINSWTVRTIAADPTDVGPFATTISTKAFLAVILGGGWIAAALALSVSMPGMAASIYLGPYIMFLILQGALFVPLQASQQMRLVALLGVCDKVVALCLTLALFKFLPASPNLLAIALIGGSAAASAAAAAAVWPFMSRLRMPSPRDVLALWRQSLSFGVVGLASQLQRADVAVVAIVAGPGPAGLYGAPARLTPLLGVIPASFSAAMFPAAAASRSVRQLRRDLLIPGIGMLALMAVAIALTYALAPAAVTLILGRSYVSSGPVLQALAIVMFISAINQPLVMLLLARRQERFVAWVVSIAEVIGLSAIGIGAHLAGAIGAVYGVGFLQVFLLAALTFKTIGLASRQSPTSS